MIDTTKTIQNLFKVFKQANKELFNNSIKSTPCITYMTDEKGKTLGHFIDSQLWKEGTEKATELNVVCNVNRSKNNIIETLIHEMVHLYCYEQGIKDTSNKGVYHNKEFKKECENHGLKCEKGKYGYSQTSLDEKGLKFANNCKEEFNQIRGNLPKQSKKQKQYKYCCDICKATFRTTKPLFLTCTGNANFGTHEPIILKYTILNDDESEDEES